MRVNKFTDTNSTDLYLNLLRQAASKQQSGPGGRKEAAES
jgi:hypothetical protein